MKDSLCLLLTSTIEVRHRQLVTRNRTEQRIEDYKTSLRKWLTRQNGVKKIVFADNSGYPLEELKEMAGQWNQRGKEVEFLSLAPHPEIPQRGKSLGEIDMMHQAMRESRLLKEAGVFVKVTGRLFIPNTEKIVKALPERFDVAGQFSPNLTYMDTTVIFSVRRILKQKSFLLPRNTPAMMIFNISKGCLPKRF